MKKNKKILVEFKDGSGRRTKVGAELLNEEKASYGRILYTIKVCGSGEIKQVKKIFEYEKSEV